MIAWIHHTDLDTYKYLCAQEGYDPVVLSETDDLAHVQMSVQTTQTWMMMGYWIQMG